MISGKFERYNDMLPAFRSSYFNFEEDSPTYVISGCLLYLTCMACPEQYDVFLAETKEQVGYLRLRHGVFTAEYPDVGRKRVYISHPEGDGIFDDMERMPELKNAVEKLLEAHEGSKQMEFKFE